MGKRREGVKNEGKCARSARAVKEYFQRPWRQPSKCRGGAVDSEPPLALSTGARSQNDGGGASSPSLPEKQQLAEVFGAIQSPDDGATALAYYPEKTATGFEPRPDSVVGGCDGEARSVPYISEGGASPLLPPATDASATADTPSQDRPSTGNRSPEDVGVQSPPDSETASSTACCYQVPLNSTTESSSVSKAMKDSKVSTYSDRTRGSIWRLLRQPRLCGLAIRHWVPRPPSGSFHNSPNEKNCPGGASDIESGLKNMGDHKGVYESLSISSSHSPALSNPLPTLPTQGPNTHYGAAQNAYHRAIALRTLERQQILEDEWMVARLRGGGCCGGGSGGDKTVDPTPHQPGPGLPLPTERPTVPPTPIITPKTSRGESIRSRKPSQTAATRSRAASNASQKGNPATAGPRSRRESQAKLKDGTTASGQPPHREARSRTSSQVDPRARKPSHVGEAGPSSQTRGTRSRTTSQAPVVPPVPPIP